MPSQRSNHSLQHQPSLETIKEHFGTTDARGLAKCIQAMGQKDLQAMFTTLYGPTASNNNSWLRRKLLEAVGLHAVKTPGKTKPAGRAAKHTRVASSSSLGSREDISRLAVRQLVSAPDALDEVRRTKRLRKPKQYQDMLVEQAGAPATPTLSRGRRQLPVPERSASPERSPSLSMPASEESFGMPWSRNADNGLPRFIGSWTSPGWPSSVSHTVNRLPSVGPSTPQAAAVAQAWSPQSAGAGSPQVLLHSPHVPDIQSTRMNSMPLLHNIPVDERSDSNNSSVDSFRYHIQDPHKIRSMSSSQPFFSFPGQSLRQVPPTMPQMCLADLRHLAASPVPIMPLTSQHGQAESFVNSFLTLEEAPHMCRNHSEAAMPWNAENAAVGHAAPVHTPSSAPSYLLPVLGASTTAMDLVMRHNLGDVTAAPGGALEAEAMVGKPSSGGDGMDFDTLDFVNDVMYRFNPSTSVPF